MAFSIATWNILATSYIRREFYPQTPPEVLDPAWRLPAVARRAAALGVDILCLQEVEVPAYAALQESMAGFAGVYVAKGRGRPDGCATFFRKSSLTLSAEEPLLTLNQGGRKFAVLNTHLKWDPPGTPRERQVGYRQVMQAIDALAQAGPVDGRILCGDLNVTPDSAVVEAVLAAGMNYAHRQCAGIATCNSNRQAKLIDYLFFSGSLHAKPVRPEPIDDETILPSPGQPSDHLPLVTSNERIIDSGLVPVLE
jgi:mRNA deadenylase 3'-5' endonuclease subunit Ccr4